MGSCRAADLAGANHAAACPEAHLLNASAKNLHAELPRQADLWMMPGSLRNTFFRWHAARDSPVETAWQRPDRAISGASSGGLRLG